MIEKTATKKATTKKKVATATENKVVKKKVIKKIDVSNAEATQKQAVVTDKTIFKAFFGGLRKYFRFKGRASRYDFWAFTLVSIIVSLILIIIDAFTGLPNVLSNIFSFVVLIPTIAIAARRLHDINKSGWWMLLPYGVAFGFVLIIAGLSVVDYSGSGLKIIDTIKAILYILIGVGIFASLFYLLVLYCSPGDKKTNDYGAPVNEDYKYEGKSLNLIISVIVWLPFTFFLLIAIFAGYSGLMAKTQLKNAQEQLRVLSTNIRKEYGANNNYYGLTNADLDSTIIPESMSNPYNNLIITARANLVYVYSDNPESFTITYAGVTGHDCEKYVATDWGMIEDTGFKGMRVGNSPQFNYLAVPTGICECAESGCSIEWEFE